MPQKTIIESLDEAGHSFGIYYQYPPATLYYRKNKKKDLSLVNGLMVYLFIFLRSIFSLLKKKKKSPLNYKIFSYIIYIDIFV